MLSGAKQNKTNRLAAVVEQIAQYMLVNLYNQGARNVEKTNYTS